MFSIRGLCAATALGAAALIPVTSGGAAATASSSLLPSTSVVIQTIQTSSDHGQLDEYVVLRNVSSGSISISGWQVQVFDRAFSATRPKFTVKIWWGVLAPRDDSNPGGAQYWTLAEWHHGFGDQFYASPDATGVPDDGGARLVRPDPATPDPYDFVVVDGVGFSAGLACTETAPATWAPGPVSRDRLSLDTNNNFVDFRSES